MKKLLPLLIFVRLALSGLNSSVQTKKVEVSGSNYFGVDLRKFPPKVKRMPLSEVHTLEVIINQGF